jgi:hypothetical protein
MVVDQLLGAANPLLYTNTPIAVELDLGAARLYSELTTVVWLGCSRVTLNSYGHQPGLMRNSTNCRSHLVWPIGRILCQTNHVPPIPMHCPGAFLHIAFSRLLGLQLAQASFGSAAPSHHSFPFPSQRACHMTNTAESALTFTPVVL